MPNSLRSGPSIRDWVAWTAAALLLLRIGVATSGIALLVGNQPPPTEARTFEALSTRFEKLRDHLPRGQAVLGYASPLEPSDPNFELHSSVAKYVLAPVAVDMGDQHDVVIADFESDDQLAAYVARRGGSLRAHPDIGLALVERPR